ncbi:unnamed protein product, partial [Prunus brigantina]
VSYEIHPHATSCAEVLDAIFLSNLWDIHIEAKMLRHVLLEKNASGTMGVETLLNSGFLQVFLWEPRLAGLVSKEKAIPLTKKRNLPFISKSGDVVGEFPKTSPKPRTQSPHSSGKTVTPASSSQKREARQNVGKEQSTSKPKRFIPKVAPSGPPRTKEATPLERPQPSKPIISESPSCTGKAPGTSPLRCKSAGTPTVVTVDDDSDDGDTTESEANVPEQENVEDANDMREDSNRDYNEDCNEDAFAYSSDHPGEQGGLDAFFEPAGIHSPSNTFDTLVEAALAGSSPIMTQTSSRDEAPTFQVMSPLPPISRHFLQRDLNPAILPTLPAAFRNNTSTVHTTLPVPSRVQPLLQAAAEDTQATITVAGNAAAEHPPNMSWLEWEESFTAFMAFFDSGSQVIRSADELLPLCHRFNGYTPFQGILVYPETVAALEKFLDKYGDFMDMDGVISSFSRCAAFRTLGLVLHGMDTVQLLDITDHRLLCW